MVDSIVSRKCRERERFDERGKTGTFGWCRRGGGDKVGGRLFVVREVRNPIGVSRRLVEFESDLVGAGKDRGEGASDSEEEDSSEVSSSDSVVWSGMILEGTGRAVGDGLSESDQNDGGRCGRV